MVLGVAQLYGIEMMPNFRQPYFSTSLGDFWRRWHISLGAWMRDYLFYPFALTKPMQRFGKWATSHWGKHFGRVLPAAVANLLVFAVVGIWHGPQAHYLAWGLYNGLVIALADLLEPLSKSSTQRCTFLPKAAAGTFFASCGPLSSSTSAGTLTAMSLCRGASTCATPLRISIFPHWPRMHPALSRQSPARPGGLSSSVPFWSLPKAATLTQRYSGCRLRCAGVYTILLFSWYSSALSASMKPLVSSMPTFKKRAFYANKHSGLA